MASGSFITASIHRGKLATARRAWRGDDLPPCGGGTARPIGARMLLRCWDEPARKATFTVSIDAPPDRMAVANMPVAADTPLAAGLRRVRFATTPRMSTYLLFVTVGDYERVHRMVDGIDVGVVVILVALDQAHTPGTGRYGFRRWALGRLAPVAARVGNGERQGEDANFAPLRSSLLLALARCGDARVVAWARGVRASRNATAADRQAALEVTALRADAATFDALLAEVRPSWSERAS